MAPGSLGTVGRIGFVLLGSVLLSAGEAAADPLAGQAHPQVSGELSDSGSLLFQNRTDRVTLAPTNDGSVRAECLRLQGRASDRLALGPRETIWYTAWMTDSDGESKLLQCAHPYGGDACDRGCAGRQEEVTGVLPTKPLRAGAIQAVTHESIGDFVLPAGLPQVENWAIILSVAAPVFGAATLTDEGWTLLPNGGPLPAEDASLGCREERLTGESGHRVTVGWCVVDPIATDLTTDRTGARIDLVTQDPCPSGWRGAGIRS